MWLPSFLSVLSDLWNFLWKGNSETHSSNIAHNSNHHSTSVHVNNHVALPVLQSGVVYTDTHYATQQIRTALAKYDPHVVSNEALTMREWLLFTVSNHMTNPPLLALSMSPLGSWHKTFQGLSGAAAVDEPLTGTIMELADAENTTFSVLVTSVTPDQTITVGTVGAKSPGLYTEQTFSKSEWVELSPVFTVLG